ncbi:EcsC family protein [Pilimelia columellifera]|uniref:EcsC family protein n=1 Tax=Pilimelia columellifera subsp. columellifera TaxID=706583 RepID=A0ABN3NNC2_9ACTN
MTEHAAVPPVPDVPLAPPPVPGQSLAGAGPVVGPASDAIGPDSGLWRQMKADPEYAPEHLALAAVRVIGPQAQAWAAQMRAHYAGVQPDQLAHWAVKRFTTHARVSGAISGATGLPGAVLDVGVLAWTQARLSLHVAAAYGYDPTHPDRAVELLVLQQVHQIAQTARTALGVAAGRERVGALLSQSGHQSVGRTMTVLAVRLAKMSGMRAAQRIFAKLIPGASIILGAWSNSAAATELGRRAVAHYRRPALPGQRVP